MTNMLSPRVDPMDVKCPKCKSGSGHACTIVRDPETAKARAAGTVYTNIRRGLHTERIIAAHEERVNRAAAAEKTNR